MYYTPYFLKKQRLRVFIRIPLHPPAFLAPCNPAGSSGHINFTASKAARRQAGSRKRHSATGLSWTAAGKPGTAASPKPKAASSPTSKIRAWQFVALQYKRVSLLQFFGLWPTKLLFGLKSGPLFPLKLRLLFQKLKFWNSLMFLSVFLRVKFSLQGGVVH